MKTRAVGIMTGLLAVFLLVPALAQDKPKEQQSEELYDQLDEARLNVELLSLDLDAEKNQLRQHNKMVNSEHDLAVGFGMGFGGGGGGFNGKPMSPEDAEKERQKSFAELREQYDQLKVSTLETSKKLRRERRRVAELEKQLGEPPSPESRPDLDRRLRDVEQKLDRILKELEEGQKRR
jgi:hypothetical protein